MKSVSQDIFDIIKSSYSSMSKGQKRIADFLLSNYDKAVFMTAGRLAGTVSVSESTVVRFASSLGYDGYPHMQKSLQDAIKTKLTTVQRIEYSRDFDSSDSFIKDTMYKDIDYIKKTVDELNIYKLQSISKAIKKARKVYIIANRSSKVLADYLAFYLNFIHDDVNYVPNGANDLYDQLIHATQQDLVIVITFPRYSRRTIDVVDYLADSNIPTIAITDSYSSPIASKVDIAITAHYNMETFIDSLVAPMSLINALIISLSYDYKEELENKFNTLENIWEKYQIYL